MATNNDGHLLDDGGNVAVDFVWGPFPLQPNDVRPNAVGAIGTPGRLDFSLDTHNIAETGWNGYPLYVPNTEGGFTSGIAYAVVPNILGLTQAEATDALKDAGLAAGAVTTSGTGATEENDGLVKTQQYSAGAEKALATTVSFVLYAYVA
jgi:hypothetical protein